MKISTKGRYGLRAIVDIALFSNGGKITLGSIAERLMVSENYLEHIFAILRKMGMVKSIKGSKGGYFIAGSLSDLSVRTVLRSLEGDLSVIGDDDLYSDENKIDTFLNLKLWSKIDNSIDKVVGSITINDLIREYKLKKDYNSFVYHI
ncbi:MAG: Rrf2 family transcriptional regulator [Clostridiales bacterium]